MVPKKHNNKLGFCQWVWGSIEIKPNRHNNHKSVQFVIKPANSNSPTLHAAMDVLPCGVPNNP